jgi:hypothetical protein
MLTTHGIVSRRASSTWCIGSPSTTPSSSSSCCGCLCPTSGKAFFSPVLVFSPHLQVLLACRALHCSPDDPAPLAPSLVPGKNFKLMFVFHFLPIAVLRSFSVRSSSPLSAAISTSRAPLACVPRRTLLPRPSKHSSSTRTGSAIASSSLEPKPCLLRRPHLRGFSLSNALVLSMSSAPSGPTNRCR